jgi:hypothetical protein
MENFKELYIVCEPLDTPLGKINFLKVKDYPLLLQYIPYLSLQKFEVIDKIREKSDDLAKYYDEKQFIEIIHELSAVYELETVYSQLFYLCFNKDVFNLVRTDEEFEYYKNLITDMNCLVYEKKNPNPEIEYFNQLKRLYSKQKSSGINFESIYTSVWLMTGQNPIDMYIYQLHSLFNRIAHFKNHDMTVLYSSVSDKIKVENWYSSFVKEEDNKLTSLNELQKQNGQSL